MFYPVQNHGEGLVLLVFLVRWWGRQYVGRDYGKEEEGSEVRRCCLTRKVESERRSEQDTST